VTTIITRFGLLGVFLLMLPESACIPIPSELTLLFSGFAVSQGWMSLPLAILAATAGNVVGSLFAYWLGATGMFSRVPGARVVLRRWEGLLDRHGTRAVFIARLLPLARTFVSLPAGARRVPLGSFLAMTVAGCLIWAAGFVIAGVLTNTAWQAIGSVAGQVLLALGVAVMLLSLVRRSK
jgi:membrane protein DedA with SNARE-associated domain